jgi:hypothetical protein
MCENHIFQIKKSEKIGPQKKKRLKNKKKRVNVFTIKSYMMTHDDMHHEHYEKCIESQSLLLQGGGERFPCLEGSYNSATDYRSLGSVSTLIKKIKMNN